MPRSVRRGSCPVQAGVNQRTVATNFGEHVAVEPVMGLSSTEVGEMPKENIVCDTSENLRLEIQWVPNCYVQLGTVDWTRTPDDPNAQGMYLTLDRAGVNRAIHTLRKARDAAFGKDA